MAVKITITFWDPVDPEAFEQHYVGVHAPLVRDLPGLRAYEYGRALTNFDGTPADAFWVVSLAFDSEEAMHASFASAAPTRAPGDAGVESCDQAAPSHSHVVPSAPS